MAVVSDESLIDTFSRLYGKHPRLFFAPGRVNLIGEHTDYNDGFVLPFAIDRGTSVAAAPREDRILNVHSLNRHESVRFDLETASTIPRGHWVNYVEGVAHSLRDLGQIVGGADLLIHSDVPLGAGLSSSAALEISVGLALCGLTGTTVNPLTLVRAAHRTEIDYVGTQSGVMDPYISIFAEEGACLLIDCRTLTSHSVPLILGDLSIVITDTCVKHTLASSGYNRRRSECREAIDRIRRFLPAVESLRDLTLEQLSHIQAELPGVLLNRCRHVLTENRRTLDAVRALRDADFPKLGQLMFQSHHSLAFDYQVTSPELDLLVHTAKDLKGVLGSRMTGGGFGGCTITLLHREAAQHFCEATSDIYHQAFAAYPKFLTAVPSRGAHEKLLVT